MLEYYLGTHRVTQTIASRNKLLFIYPIYIILLYCEGDLQIITHFILDSELMSVLILQ